MTTKQQSPSSHKVTVTKGTEASSETAHILCKTQNETNKRGRKTTMTKHNEKQIKSNET